MANEGGNEKRINLSTESQEFLFSSYFEESYDSLVEKIQKNEDTFFVCFNRAYRDFNRTLKFKNKMTKNFPKDVYEGKNGGVKLKNKLDKILKAQNLNEFKKGHEDICNKIMKNTENISSFEKPFSYGQAQKWVNMTLKYMSLIGLWDDKLDSVREFLQIPIDNYILKALFYIPRKGESISKQINLMYRKDYPEKSKLINDETLSYVKGDGTFIIENNNMLRTDEWEKNKKGITWSNIKDSDDYKCIQCKIKEQMPMDKEFKSDPLAWENKVWIYAAQIIK